MELHDRVSKLEDNYESIRDDVNNIKIRMSVAETNIREIKDDLSHIRSNTNWILRLIVGAIVGAVLGLILKSGI